MLKYVCCLLCLVIALSACDKQREATRATGDVPKEIMTKAKSSVNDSMLKAEEKLKSATEENANDASPTIE